MPLLILSHGEAASAGAFPAGWPTAEQEQLWQALQKEMAGLIPSGEQRTVANSGHMIHQAQPYVVIDAIKEIVDAIRAAT